jgi:hypothetical protein
MKKLVKERTNNVCVAVKRGVRVRWNCNVFNLAMEIVLKGLPDKIRDQLSNLQTSYTKQKHFKCTHFWITGDEIGVPVYIKTMQSCSSTFDTSSQSFQRKDDKEVHTISCFLSEADEMQYIGTLRVFPQVNLFFHLGKGARSSRWCVLHTRKWRHPCTLILILEFSDNMKQPAAILVLPVLHTILVLPVFYQNLPVSAILVQILVNTRIPVSSRIVQYLQY